MSLVFVSLFEMPYPYHLTHGPWIPCTTMPSLEETLLTGYGSPLHLATGPVSHLPQPWHDHTGHTKKGNGALLSTSLSEPEGTGERSSETTV